MELSIQAINLLRDLETATYELLDSLKEKTGIGNPRILATMNKILEDPESKVMGKYYPSSSVIALNYGAELPDLIHLYSHHIQAYRLGQDKYEILANEDEARLPWVMRRLEIDAMRLATTITQLLDQKAAIEWEHTRRSISKSLEQIRSSMEFRHKWSNVITP